MGYTDCAEENGPSERYLSAPLIQWFSNGGALGSRKRCNDLPVLAFGERFQRLRHVPQRTHRQQEFCVSVPFGGGFFQIDWPSPFPDANYTVVGSVEDLQINFGIQLQFVNLSLKTASSVNVFISNANETSKNAVINLIAMHD